MNKTHWNSVRAQGSVPDDLLRNLLDEAYRLVLHALPKKAICPGAFPFVSAAGR